MGLTNSSGAAPLVLPFCGGDATCMMGCRENEVNQEMNQLKEHFSGGCKRVGR